MGYDYALVHATYTLPPALLLTFLHFPLTTKLDCYKTLFLIAIAVASTIPWDSYLIRANIWSYPDHVVLGWSLARIPVEEVFFFVIQTYNTTLLYLLLSKPVLHSVYLVKEKKGGGGWRYVKLGGQLVFGLSIKKGIDWIRADGEHTYLGLILVWAAPFLFLLWSLAYQFLVRLPLTNTLLPIALPTFYLWVVDTLALKRGTWVISAATKTGLTLWPGLEIEEALFFLLTNTLIVFGLVAFDNALAILHTFPAHFPHLPALPTPALLVRALLLPAPTYDDDRILGLQQSVARLRAKSRSFYLASATFPGRLRLDLIILYSFCRLADDLIDHAASPADARAWLQSLKRFLDLSYHGDVQNAAGHTIPATDKNQGQATLFAYRHFPPDALLTLLLLPTDRLAREPLYELLKGFEMDLAFSSPSSSSSSSSSAPLTGPIKSEADLDLYGARVAGTVALLCIQLVLFHHPLPAAASPAAADARAKRLMAAGHTMGIALQYTNIARDLRVDAAGEGGGGQGQAQAQAQAQAQGRRCYVPAAYLKKEKLTAESFVAGLVREDAAGDAGDAAFFAKKVAAIRGRLLDRAFAFYEGSRAAIEELPREARAPMRVAVESYMQIGRELRRDGGRGRGGRRGRATVPVWRRVVVGWRALVGPVG